MLTKWHHWIFCISLVVKYCLMNKLMSQGFGESCKNKTSGAAAVGSDTGEPLERQWKAGLVSE